MQIYNYTKNCATAIFRKCTKMALSSSRFHLFCDRRREKGKHLFCSSRGKLNLVTVAPLVQDTKLLDREVHEMEKSVKKRLMRLDLQTGGGSQATLGPRLDNGPASRNGTLRLLYLLC